MSKTAIVFGATGLIGEYVLDILLEDERYKQVWVFARSNIRRNHSKLGIYYIDFSTLELYGELFMADDIFVCVGTTLRKAGSVKNFRKVDVDIPKIVADAAKNGITKNFGLISSIGANENSRSYYIKAKGEVEQYILDKGFENTNIMRPSLLMGPRKEFRFFELFYKFLMTVFGFMLVGKLKKYKGIHARKVAEVMVELANKPSDKNIWESDEIAEFTE